MFWHSAAHGCVPISGDLLRQVLLRLLVQWFVTSSFVALVCVVICYAKFCSAMLPVRYLVTQVFVALRCLRDASH